MVREGELRHVGQLDGDLGAPPETEPAQGGRDPDRIGRAEHREPPLSIAQ
ncbi:hypothetical protein ACPCUV_05775 [Streptomyces platensis]